MKTARKIANQTLMETLYLFNRGGERHAAKVASTAGSCGLSPKPRQHFIDSSRAAGLTIINQENCGLRRESNQTRRNSCSFRANGEIQWRGHIVNRLASVPQDRTVSTLGGKIHSTLVVFFC